MKVLKKIGIILGIALLVFLILGLIMSKKITVVKSVDMDAPANYVYNIVNDLTTNEQWNAWAKEDTTTKIILGDITSGPGASYSYTSQSTGNGELKYTEVKTGQEITGHMSFEGGDPSPFKYTFTPDGNTSEMNWEMTMKLPYPMNVFSPFMKWMMKSSFKKSMKNIEEIAIQRFEKSEYLGYKIETQKVDARHFVMNRSMVSFPNIQKFYTQNLGAIFQKVQEKGITMNGMPSGLFFKYDPSKNETDMAAAIPVKEYTDIEGLTSLTIPSKDALVLNYYGDYEGVEKAHSAIDAYMKDRNLVYDPPVIEEYVTDPLEEKDPGKWLTKVIYYLASK